VNTLKQDVAGLKADVAVLKGATTGQTASQTEPPGPGPLDGPYMTAYNLSAQSKVPLVIGVGFDPPASGGYNVVRVTPTEYFRPDTLIITKPGTGGNLDVVTRLSKGATATDVCNCLMGAGCICGVNCQCTTMTGIQGTQWPYSAPPSYIGGGFAPLGYGGTTCGPNGCGTSMGFTGFGGMMGGGGCANGQCGGSSRVGLLGRIRGR
jgi:hypothetical protein